MKAIHIKNFVKPAKDLEKRIEFYRVRQPKRFEASLERLQISQKENFFYILWCMFEMDREMAFDASLLYKLTKDKEDGNKIVPHLRKSFAALEALIHGVTEPDAATQAVTVNGVTGELKASAPPPTRSEWAVRLFESISMRRPDLVEKLMKYDPESAAQHEPRSPDLARFYVNYIKGMLDPNGQHQRFYQQYTQVFRDQFNFRAQVNLIPLYYVATGNELEYEKAMRVAGKAHHKAAMSDHIPLGVDQMIFPSDLIATASLAYDRHGWTLKHTNDYIPEWWIYNRFDDVPEIL